MSTRVLSTRPLLKHWSLRDRSDSEEHLRAWHEEAEKATWRRFTDVQRAYASAVGVDGDRVVFSIGRRYKLVVKMNYVAGVACVRFVGTQDEYDGIDPRTI